MKAFASSPDVAAYGAAGSTLGTAMGALTAVLFMGFLYAVYTPTFNRLKRKDRHTENQSTGQICKIIIYTIKSINFLLKKPFQPHTIRTTCIFILIN